MEKCLAFKKTIQKIKFSKNSLEVIIFIEDTTSDEILNLSGLGSGRTAARIRGEHRTPAPPTVPMSSNNKNVGPAGLEPATR